MEAKKRGELFAAAFVIRSFRTVPDDYNFKYDEVDLEVVDLTRSDKSCADRRGLSGS